MFKLAKSSALKPISEITLEDLHGKYNVDDENVIQLLDFFEINNDLEDLNLSSEQLQALNLGKKLLGLEKW
jgi:hypothetical protein